MHKLDAYLNLQNAESFAQNPVQDDLIFRLLLKITVGWV